MQGVVVYYNKEKAYGFIDSNEHEKNIFVHFSKSEPHSPKSKIMEEASFVMNTR